MSTNTSPVGTDTPTDSAPTGYEFYGQRITTPVPAPVWNQPAVVPTPATRIPLANRCATAPMNHPWPHNLPVDHPNNITGLICGIIGVAGFPPVGIIALMLGIKANNDIHRNPMKYRGYGTATANIILGSFSTVLTLLAALFFFMMLMYATMY